MLTLDAVLDWKDPVDQHGRSMIRKGATKTALGATSGDVRYTVFRRVEVRGEYLIPQYWKKRFRGSDQYYRSKYPVTWGYCDAGTALRMYRRRQGWDVMVNDEGVKEERLEVIRGMPCGVTPALLKRIIWGEVAHAEAVYAAEGQMFRQVAHSEHYASAVHDMELWLLVVSRIVPFRTLFPMLKRHAELVAVNVLANYVLRGEGRRRYSLPEAEYEIDQEVSDHWKKIRDEVEKFRCEKLLDCQRKATPEEVAAHRMPLSDRGLDEWLRRSEDGMADVVECEVPEGCCSEEYWGCEGEQSCVEESDLQDSQEVGPQRFYSSVESIWGYRKHRFVGGKYEGGL